MFLKHHVALISLFVFGFFGAGAPGFSAEPAPWKASVKTADAVYQRIDKSYRIKKDGSFTLTLHLRVKILTYKGKKDHADFKYPYNAAYQSVKILTARTLSLSGKVIPVDPREIHDITSPEDAGAAIYSRQRVKVVNFPSVTPGSTVEITLKLHSGKGFWATECFRLHDPIKLKTVGVSLPVEMPLSKKLPVLSLKYSEKKVKKQRVLRWEAGNIPGFDIEPLAPPYENRGTCLFLSTFSSWKVVGRFFTPLFSKPLSRGAGNILKETAPDALYVAFMKHFISYPIDLFHTNLVFQSPAVTAEKGYGSSMDLAILFYSLLKQKGETPALLLANADRIFIREFRDMPTPALFNDVIVRCGNSDYAFNRRELPPGYTGLEGMAALDIHAGMLTGIHSRYSDKSTTRLDLRATPDFSLSGTFETISEGTQAVSMRAWLRHKSDEEWRIAASQILHGIDPLAQPLKAVVKKGIDVLTVPVTLRGAFRISRLFPVSGAFSFTAIPSPDLPDGLKTCLETRQGPLMISRKSTDVLEEKIIFPEGTRILHHPASTRGKSKILEWKTTFSVYKNSISFRRVLQLNRGILYPRTAPYFRFLKTLKNLARPSARLIVFEKTR